MLRGVDSIDSSSPEAGGQAGGDTRRSDNEKGHSGQGSLQQQVPSPAPATWREGAKDKNTSARGREKKGNTQATNHCAGEAKMHRDCEAWRARQCRVMKEQAALRCSTISGSM